MNLPDLQLIELELPPNSAGLKQGMEGASGAILESSQPWFNPPPPHHNIPPKIFARLS